MEKVRLGIAGPGRIVRRVMKDLRKAERIEIRAVASRSAERAQSAGEEYGIPLRFGSYEDMAKSDEVDLVYVALPHPFHCAVSQLFLKGGKHVIVEKPFAVNGREAREMVTCARDNGRYLMEAMWSRFFPAALALRELIAGGGLGEIRRMTGDFAFKAEIDYSDRLYNRALGGGSLLDVGVYPLSLMCYYKGELPTASQVFFTKTETDVDGLCAFQIQFADGGVGQGFSALDVDTDQSLKVYGTKGWAEMPNFWHPTSFTVHLRDQASVIREFAPENEGFHHEFDYVAQAILSGKTDQSIIPLSESVAIMDIMDSMRAQMGVVYPGELR